MADTFRVERSTLIDAPAAAIFPHINDFHAWADWSPFEKMDADLAKTFSGPQSGLGAAYAWVGLKGETIANVWSVNHWVGSQMALLHKSVHGGGVCALADDPDEGAWTL